MAEVQEVEARVKAPAVTKKHTTGSNSNADAMAIGALALGLLNLCGWCFPLCGVPLSIVGIVLGVIGMKSEKNKMMAVIGLVLSVLALIASIVAAIAGFAMSFNDLH